MQGNKQFLLWIGVGLITLIGFSSCRDAVIPRPYGYFRIDLPEQAYQQFSSKPCGFQFEYPDYGTILPYTGNQGNDCWYNFDMPEFSARLHLSYLPIDESRLRTYIEESHSLAYKHQVKASGIEEERIDRPEAGVHGIVYHIRGNAASPLQFFVTDSLQHFLRGSLYFQNRPNADSLAPVLTYIESDIQRLITTLQWMESE